MPDDIDGPAIFTGRMAIYMGPSESLQDESGTLLQRGIPVAVSDAAAMRLARSKAIMVTPATFHARGAGCC